MTWIGVLLAAGMLVTTIGLCPAEPVTSGTTAETTKLLAWIARNNEPVAIGAQHIANESGWDVQKRISGYRPLIFGIEYRDSGGWEKDIKYWDWSQNQAIALFREGGIVTIVDHMPNFATGGNAFDKYPGLPGELLPGGRFHAAYTSYLDRFAQFVRGISADGVQVPILYRPFHEMNGGWFWWGKSSDFVALWRFTFTYLTQVQGLKTLLWVWAPSVQSDSGIGPMGDYWPGKDYVDVVGLDGYSNSPNGSFADPVLRSSYASAVSIADASGKPFVWSEVGFEKTGCDSAGFWTNDFLKSLDKYYPRARFVLIWNGKWGPRNGCPAAQSFKDMMANPRVLTSGRISSMQIYGHRLPPSSQ